MSIYDLKKNVKPKLSQSSFDTTGAGFKFKSYNERLNSTTDQSSSNGKSSMNRFHNSSLNKVNKVSGNKFGSEHVLNTLVHSKQSKAGKIQKSKPKKFTNTNLECFNLLEKEKFRQLIEQNENYRPIKNQTSIAQSINQKNVYKHFIHSSPTRIRDDNSSDAEKFCTTVSGPCRVSAGYTRRISVSGDSKLEASSKSNGISFFNKYSGNGILKNSSNNLFNSNNKSKSNTTLNSSNGTNVIEEIDLCNISTLPGNKCAQKRSGLIMDENDKRNDIENFRKEKKDFFSLYNNVSTFSKVNRELTDFEKNIDERLRNNQSIIEAVLKKSQTKLDSNQYIIEERYKLKKRQRQEKDLIERELALKFTQQLHVDSDKNTGKYLEEDLEVEEENEFPELQDDHVQLIEKAFINTPQDEVLVNAFNVPIYRKDIQTLKGLNWLNDEIINFYMTLICERSKDEAKSLPKVHAFSTFFYPRLREKGYSMIKRWTKKVDIFSYDLILIPIHLGLHWTLAVIDFTTREIRYYDSMNGNNKECLKALKNYLNEEHQDKKGAPYDLTDWNCIHNKDLPQQMNGSDCGMFSCKYAEYLSRGKTTFNFNQSHMPYFRRRMVWEILNTKLM